MAVKKATNNDYLTEEKIDYLLDLVKNNNYSKEELVDKLIHICTYRSLMVSLVYYYAYEKVRDKLLKIIEVWDSLKKEGLFEEYKNFYKCSYSEVDIRLDKLNMIYQIYLSNVDDYHKADKMLELVGSRKQFYQWFSLLFRYGKNDKKLDKGREALNHYEEIYQKLIELEKKGIWANVKYLQSLKNEIKGYPYAKFIVSAYVTNKNSYKVAAFLDYYGLDMDSFEYCVYVIRELDVDLYEKYCQKKEENKKLRIKHNKETLLNLAEDIKKGEENGTPLNPLEFIKRIPFKSRGDFLKCLYDFLEENLAEEYKVIVDYMGKNGLRKIHLFKPFDINELENIKVTINGREITKKDNETILKYLRVNGYPIISQSYYYAREMYIKKDIKTEEVEKKYAEYQKKLTKKVIQIP